MRYSEGWAGGSLAIAEVKRRKLMSDWSRAAGTLQTERKRLPWEKDDFRILSLDGGGIRGLFTAAVLSKWEERTEEPIWKYFDYIAGTSTGGIMALGLGKGLRAKEIENTYDREGPVIFRDSRGLSSWVRQLVRAKHGNTTLKRTLERVLQETRFGESRRMLAIQAAEGEYGQAFVYKTPHHPDFRNDWKETMVDVGVATSAAPTYFTAVKHGGYMMLDGGLAANDPILVALVDALTCFEIERRQVRILSIGCQTQKVRVTESLRRGGRLRWALQIVGIMNQILSHQSQGQAGLLIGRDRLVRIDPQSESREIGLDDWRTAKRLLPGMAQRAAEHEWERVKDMFFTDVREDYVCQVEEAKGRKR